MTINELMSALRLPLNTWDVPVYVNGKEIVKAELRYTEDRKDLYVELIIEEK